MHWTRIGPCAEFKRAFTSLSVSSCPVNGDGLCSADVMMLTDLFVLTGVSSIYKSLTVRQICH